MSSSSLRLTGKLALVTGAGGTIGQSICKALVLEGASVVMTGRNLQRLEKAAQIIKEAVGAASPSSPQLHCISCDVSDETSVINLFEELDQKSMFVDIVVNNAGVINKPTTTDNVTAADFDWVQKVNVLGPFLCAREAMKRMMKTKKSDNGEDTSTSIGGKIVNIGSISALSPRPNSAPYSTSKFALLGLTQSLALDGRPYNISCGIIHPGNVISELLTKEMYEKRKVEGFMDAKEVADCVLTMVLMPPNATVLELTVMPTQQPLVGRG